MDSLAYRPLIRNEYAYRIIGNYRDPATRWIRDLVYNVDTNVLRLNVDGQEILLADSNEDRVTYGQTRQTFSQVRLDEYVCHVQFYRPTFFDKLTNESHSTLQNLPLYLGTVNIHNTPPILQNCVGCKALVSAVHVQPIHPRTPFNVVMYPAENDAECSAFIFRTDIKTYAIKMLEFCAELTRSKLSLSYIEMDDIRCSPDHFCLINFFRLSAANIDIINNLRHFTNGTSMGNLPFPCVPDGTQNTLIMMIQTYYAVVLHILEKYAHMTRDDHLLDILFTELSRSKIIEAQEDWTTLGLFSASSPLMKQLFHGDRTFLNLDGSPAWPDGDQNGYHFTVKPLPPVLQRLVLSLRKFSSLAIAQRIQYFDPHPDHVQIIMGFKYDMARKNDHTKGPRYVQQIRDLIMATISQTMNMLQQL